MKVAYIRTSTKDQTPELQLNQIIEVSGGYNLLLTEKQSAWSDFKERQQLKELIKLIQKRKVSHIYVWDLDRLYRNRKKLVDFFELCNSFNCQIHSVRQQWLEEINKMPEPWGNIIHTLMLDIMGWLAEEESTKKSERIKNAVTKKKNYKGEEKTYSKFGNLWGRKSLPPQTITKVLELHKSGLSLRNICKEVFIYDQYGNKIKNISLGAVHKILSENKLKKDLKT